MNPPKRKRTSRPSNLTPEFLAGVDSPFVNLSAAQRKALHGMVGGMASAGVTALFNGQEAVGRINAGIALANQTGAELYRIDLSLV